MTQIKPLKQSNLLSACLYIMYSASKYIYMYDSRIESLPPKISLTTFAYYSCYIYAICSHKGLL